MSVPLLTPLESAIFDEDVIADLEAHFDDDLACTVDDCGKAASVTVAMRCCSRPQVVKAAVDEMRRAHGPEKTCTRGDR